MFSKVHNLHNHFSVETRIWMQDLTWRDRQTEWQMTKCLQLHYLITRLIINFTIDTFFEKKVAYFHFGIHLISYYIQNINKCPISNSYNLFTCSLAVIAVAIMAPHTCLLCFLTTLIVVVVGATYAPVTASQPLYFGLMMSFGGIQNSSGVVPGVQVALDIINNKSRSDILRDYSLHYVLYDSQVSV